MIRKALTIAFAFGFILVVCAQDGNKTSQKAGKLEYGLVSNRKSLTGADHPDRDRQFRYIRRVKRLFLAAGWPIISVDAKNKELVGPFYNKGRTWRQAADPVLAHDFLNDADGLAVPYGIYDVTNNQGYVYVGTSHDTSEFAAYCIAQWWADPDRPAAMVVTARE